MFVDEATLSVSSGKGGAGCVSFHREANVPKGGPNGGNGGRGGDAWIAAISQKNTLVDYRNVHFRNAEKGKAGGGANKTGRSGEDLILRVPPGTLVFNAETNQLIADLDEFGAKVMVAKGGLGGRGNASYTTSTNRAPRRSQPGEEGDTVPLRLELKLLADAGIIGLPSVGKSTLIAAISSARPEIADYPFTTLVPNLGVVEKLDGFPFVVADVPGLIEGAHEGKGLGHQFLKHIQRTTILLHLVDCTGEDPVEDWQAVRHELASFDPALAEKPELIVINKVDAAPDGADGASILELIARFRQLGRQCLPISAATGGGCDQLVRGVARKLKQLESSS